MEIAESIDQATRAIGAVTLGQVCASGVVMLEVACRRCPRKGRYRVTRLIDRHGAGIGLPHLKQIIASDCPKRVSTSIYNRCGAYFPDVPASRP